MRVSFSIVILAAALVEALPAPRRLQAREFDNEVLEARAGPNDYYGQHSLQPGQALSPASSGSSVYLSSSNSGSLHLSPEPMQSPGRHEQYGFNGQHQYLSPGQAHTPSSTGSDRTLVDRPSVRFSSEDEYINSPHAQGEHGPHTQHPPAIPGQHRLRSGGRPRSQTLLAPNWQHQPQSSGQALSPHHQGTPYLLSPLGLPALTINPMTHHPPAGSALFAPPGPQRPHMQSARPQTPHHPSVYELPLDAPVFRTPAVPGRGPTRRASTPLPGHLSLPSRSGFPDGHQTHPQFYGGPMQPPAGFPHLTGFSPRPPDRSLHGAQPSHQRANSAHITAWAQSVANSHENNPWAHDAPPPHRVDYRP